MVTNEQRRDDPLANFSVGYRIKRLERILGNLTHRMAVIDQALSELQMRGEK